MNHSIDNSKVWANGIVAQAMAQPTSDEQARAENSTGQHARTPLTRGNEGQQRLVECYFAIKHLLPETSRGVWRSWVRAGRRVVNKMSNLKILNGYEYLC